MTDPRREGDTDTMIHGIWRLLGLWCMTALFCATAGCHCTSPCSNTWFCSKWSASRFNPSNWRTLAIPDTYPLGSVVRAHYHTMQANGEAADFILHRHEFVDETAVLTPDAKDHLLEIAARMPHAPFPVIVERSDNNSQPELDAHRRDLVAQVLTDLGVPDADQRTVVAPAYGKGLNSLEGQFDYQRYLFSRSIGGFGGFGFGGGGFGGFGGFGGGFGGGVGAAP